MSPATARGRGRLGRGEIDLAFALLAGEVAVAGADGHLAGAVLADLARRRSRRSRRCRRGRRRP